MITLREPINLISARGLLTIGDAFNEKIRANYLMMQASFMPEDLMLLLTNQEERLEQAADITNIAVSSSASEVISLKLEMLNNVVNRILLNYKDDFTYQDTVFISSILQKMGIYDISEFIRQVRNLTDESRNIYRMMDLYSQNSWLLTWVSDAVRRQRERGETGAEPGEMPHPEERYYLHNEIYDRLGIAEIYDLLYSLQVNQAEMQNVINLNELRLSEQLRVANILNLSRYKSRIFDRDSATLIHHVNRFELGDIYPPPQSEREVVERAATAALVTLIDNVLVSSLNRIARRENVWLDIKKAVTAVAENSLYRFEAYHSGQSLRNIYSPQYFELMNAAFANEIIELSKTVFSRAAEEIPRLQVQERTQESLEKAYERMQLTYVISEAERTFEVLEQLSRLEEYETILQQSRTVDSEAAERIIRQYSTEINTFVEKRAAEAAPRLPDEIYREYNILDLDHIYEHEESSYTEFRPERPGPPGPSITEISEQADVIRDGFRLIDRRNREILERLSSRPGAERTGPPVPDRARTHEAALLALEHPELFVSEIIGQREDRGDTGRRTEQQGTVHVADEYTKRILEAVEEYRRNPLAAIEAGIVRPVGAEVLNTEIRKVVEQEAVEMTHRVEESLTDTQIIQDAIESVQERLRERNYVSEPESQVISSTGTRIIHRLIDTGEDEEEEQLRQAQPVESIVKTTESRTETVENLIEQQINKISQEVVARTGEDISEIISRTLAKQIGTISERVYTQMEKRLQLERARRGRY